MTRQNRPHWAEIRIRTIEIAPAGRTPKKTSRDRTRRTDDGKRGRASPEGAEPGLRRSEEPGARNSEEEDPSSAPAR